MQVKQVVEIDGAPYQRTVVYRPNQPLNVHVEYAPLVEMAGQLLCRHVSYWPDDLFSVCVEYLPIDGDESEGE